MDSKVFGKIRGLFLDVLPTGEDKVPFPTSGQGELLVANAAAEYSEIVRQGRAFSLHTTTAVASVTAIPTTAVTIALYNNAPDGGRSLIIDDVWAAYTVNSAIIPHVGIIALLGQTRVAAPSDSGLVIRKMNGMGQVSPGRVDSVALSVVGTTVDAVTGVAIGWFPLGDSINGAVTSLPGIQKSVAVNGRYIVPPGRYFCLHTLSAATSTSAQMGIRWHEKQLLLG